MLLFVLPVWLLALSITWRRTVGVRASLRVALFTLITLACLALGLALDSYLVAAKLRGADTPQAFIAMHRASVVAPVLLATSLVLAVGSALIALKARQRV